MTSDDKAKFPYAKPEIRETPVPAPTKITAVLRRTKGGRANVDVDLNGEVHEIIGMLVAVLRSLPIPIVQQIFKQVVSAEDGVYHVEPIALPIKGKPS